MNKLAGLLAVLAIVAGTPLARADFQISVNVVNCTPTAGTNPQPSASPNGTLTCATVTPFPGVTLSTVALTGVETGPQTFSEQLGTTLLIQNTHDFPVTLTVFFAIQNFTTPVTPPEIDYFSGDTINVTTGDNSVSLFSCVDQANGLAPPGGTFCSSPGGRY